MGKLPKPTPEDTFSPRCKVCNAMVVFDRTRPMPKIWHCPSCGAKNVTKPKPDEAR
jgi:ribosomal protein L37AE/L43A